jgi:hypothetical protein
VSRPAASGEGRGRPWHISGAGFVGAVQRIESPGPEEMTDCAAGDGTEGNAESL